MSTQGILLVILSALLTIIANLTFRYTISSLGFSLSISYFLKLFLSPIFIIAMVFYFAAMVVWFRVLATELLGSSYPILVALTFTGVTVGAIFFFKEPISIIKIIGVATVFLGIILIARS